MNNYIPLVKEQILRIRPTEHQRQIVKFFGEPSGFGVRVSRRSGSQGEHFTHVFIVRKEIRGIKKSHTIGPVQSFKKAEMARQEAIRVLAEWSHIGSQGIHNKESSAQFSDVMEAYMDWLDASGKKSARTVRSTINKYIRGDETRPLAIWNMKAQDVLVEDIMQALRPIMTTTPHTAEACRQHIKAAFNKAIESLGNIDLPDSMRHLNIRFSNPCTIKKIEASKTVRERYLTENELHALMSAIDEMDNKEHTTMGTDPNIRFVEPRKAFTLFHIYTGGQRNTQLSELTASSIVLDDGQPYLRASRHQKRTGFSNTKKTHRIPLTDWILETIELMGTPTDPIKLKEVKSWEADNQHNRHYIWSLGKHDTPVSDTAICKIYSKRLNPIMIQHNAIDCSRGKIQPNSIRKTVETLLRRKPWAVPAEHLGWLQDHGIGGVQNTHYNQYDYFDEKLEALINWYKLCKNHS